MKLVRLIVAAAAIAGGIWLVGRFVVAPYSLNVQKRQLADTTNQAFASQVSAREAAGGLARNNAERLGALATRFPEDADLHVILGANLRLIGRNFEALHAYETAVRYQPTPEMYMSLGEAQLTIGMTDDARASFDRAVAFNPNFAKNVDAILQRQSAQ